MIKKFTLQLLLVAFSFLCPYLSNAQIWRPIAGIPNNGCCTFDTSRSGALLTMGPGGTPYLLYQEYTSVYANSVIVTKYNGSAWVPVGNPEFAPSYMGYPDLHVAAGKPVYVGLNAGGPEPDVWSYSGAPWSQVSPPTNSPANTTASPVSITIDATGKPWCAIYNARTNNPSVYALNNGVWSDIAGGGLGANSGGTFVQLAVDYQNTLYIAYDENNPGGPAPLLVVKKLVGQQWYSVGQTTLYSTGSNHVLAFDSYNNPFVIADDPTNGNFKLMWFSNDWIPIGPAVAATASVQTNNNHITQLYLAMGPQNTPMICYWSTVYDDNVFGYPVAFVKLSNSASVPAADTAWVPAADTTLAFAGASGNQIAFAADTLGHAALAVTSYNATNPDISAFELFPGNPKAVITFNPIDTVYGTADFAPAATSTNTDPADPITYTIADTTIARIVNGKIHILQGGTTTITASQAADKNFKAAVPVTVQLRIEQASQTITFPGWPQKKVGDPDFAAGGYASSGLPVTYDGSDPTIATVSPNGTIHIIEQGAIIVTAHQTGNNSYSAAPDLEQVLIITPADTTGSDTTNPSLAKGNLTAWSSSRSSLQVQVAAPQDGQALLELFNSFGSRLYSKQIALTTKGANAFTVPVGGMPEGIYYVRVIGNNYKFLQTIWIR